MIDQDQHTQLDHQVQGLQGNQDVTESLGVREVQEDDHAQQDQNPVLNTIRVPFEWNAVPDTQWAPNSLDPSARHDRTLFDFKVKPVIPFKLNDDWSILT